MLLSIASVAISCALLIVVASLFTGFINAYENSASDHMGDIVIGKPAGIKISRYDELITKLEESPFIKAATGVLSGQGLLLIGKGNVRAVRISGIELPKRLKVTPFTDALLRQKGTPGQPDFTVAPSQEKLGGFVGIGVIATPDDKTDEYDFDRVKKNIGTKVFLTTGTRESKRKNIKFTITDVVFTGFHDVDKNYIYLPIDALSAKLYPDRPKVADMIQIKLLPHAEPPETVAVVRDIWQQFAEETLGWSKYLISQVNVETSRAMQARLIAEYRKQMAMLMLIFSVVSFGVVLLVFCIFYLIVMTKQKDIAIIKSCGLGSGPIAALFVTFGLIIGFIGAGLGVALGCFVTKNVNTVERWVSTAMGMKLWKSSTYMFSKIPNQVNWESVVWVVVAAILAAGIGALIPAITAARMKPVTILRYE